MNVKRLLSLLFALALATSLSFAQSTSSDQSSSSGQTSTTQTKKSRKSKTKSDADTAASATADTAKDAASATAEGTEKAAKKTKKAVTGESAAEKIDINSAEKDKLSSLPGIGDVTAQKIVDGRPYHAKNDLLRKKIVTQSQYDQIKDQIIAHHTTAGAKTSAKKGAAETPKK